MISLLLQFSIILYSAHSVAGSGSDTETNINTNTKKTYIEDIFIWKMSDELKLSAAEEKKFSDIQKNLNKKKSELNKEIQEATLGLDKETESALKNLRKHIKEYNQISLDEFDAMKKLLGTKRFVSYLQIRSDLTNKVKLLLSGEKGSEKTSDKEKRDATAIEKLPPPQVIIEK